MSRLFDIAVGVSGVMVVGCGATPPGKDASGADGGRWVGKPAPELSVEYVDGEGPRSIAEAKGVVTIVDFWATFCDPCKKSFPVYQGLVDKYGGKLAVIAVSVDESEVEADDLKKFARDREVSFAIVWDKERRTACKDGCPYDPPAMPTSYIVDREGIIRSVHATYQSGDEETIDAEIEDLLR